MVQNLFFHNLISKAPSPIHLWLKLVLSHSKKSNITTIIILINMFNQVLELLIEWVRKEVDSPTPVRPNHGVQFR